MRIRSFVFTRENLFVAAKAAPTIANLCTVGCLEELVGAAFPLKGDNKPRRTLPRHLFEAGSSRGPPDDTALGIPIAQHNPLRLSAINIDNMNGGPMRVAMQQNTHLEMLDDFLNKRLSPYLMLIILNRLITIHN